MKCWRHVRDAHRPERYRSGRNGGASKASCRVTGTGVRIPPSPPFSTSRFLNDSANLHKRRFSQPAGELHCCFPVPLRDVTACDGRGRHARVAFRITTRNPVPRPRCRRLAMPRSGSVASLVDQERLERGRLLRRQSGIRTLWDRVSWVAISSKSHLNRPSCQVLTADSPNGTTCTAASRTSSRNRFRVDPFTRISNRDRAVCPNTACVIPSRFANATRPSAGLSAFTRTIVAPSCSAKAMFRRSASRFPGLIWSGVSRGVCTYTAYQRAPRRPAKRAPARMTRGAFAAELIQTITRSAMSPVATSCRSSDTIAS
jgi:hypothetical protein